MVATDPGRPIRRRRCGEWGDGCFWPVACRHEQGTALNHPSQPRGWALMHDVPSAATEGPETTSALAAAGVLRVGIWLTRTVQAVGADQPPREPCRGCAHGDRLAIEYPKLRRDVAFWVFGLSTKLRLVPKAQHAAAIREGHRRPGGCGPTCTPSRPENFPRTYFGATSPDGNPFKD